MAIDQTFINSLKNPDPIDWSTYKAPTGEGTWVKPPIPEDKEGKKVIFEGILPPGFTYDSKDGNLIVKVDPITLKGSPYQLRFTSISGKAFQSSYGDKAMVSFLANFVRSVDKTVRPQTAQDYIKAIEGFARRPFKFTADWEAYDKDTQTTVAKGYKNFPLDPKVNDGYTRLPFVELVVKPAEGDTPAVTRRVFANLKVKNYIAAK